MADGADMSPSNFALADGDLLSFENLHVDIGPEIADQITDIHWLSDENIQVSVHLPAEIYFDMTTDAFDFDHGPPQSGDWLIE